MMLVKYREEDLKGKLGLGSKSQSTKRARELYNNHGDREVELLLQLARLEGGIEERNKREKEVEKRHKVSIHI